MGYHDPGDVKIVQLIFVAMFAVIVVGILWNSIVEVAPWLPWVIYAIVGIGIVVGILLIVGFIDYSKESKKKQKIKDSIKSKILAKKRKEISKRLMSEKAGILKDLTKKEQEFQLNEWVEKELKEVEKSLGKDTGWAEKGYTVPPLSSSEQAKLIKRVGIKCEYPECEQHAHLQVHHILPRSKGGTNQWNNLIVLCPTHHAEVQNGSLSKAVLKHVIRDRHLGV